MSSSASDTTFVLVHGGGCGAWCWAPFEPFVPGRALAVDLPPKAVRGVPAADAARSPELSTVGVDEFASSVIADIDAAGFDRFVLVGHSMGGLTIPEVARRIPDRVGHLVFVSCLDPAGSRVDHRRAPGGRARADARGDERSHCRRRRHRQGGLDDATKIRMFCNDMDEEQTSFVLDAHGCGGPARVRRSGHPGRHPTDAAQDVRQAGARPGAHARGPGSPDREPPRVARGRARASSSSTRVTW